MEYFVNLTDDTIEKLGDAMSGSEQEINLLKEEIAELKNKMSDMYVFQPIQLSVKNTTGYRVVWTMGTGDPDNPDRLVGLVMTEIMSGTITQNWHSLNSFKGVFRENNSDNNIEIKMYLSRADTHANVNIVPSKFNIEITQNNNPNIACNIVNGLFVIENVISGEIIDLKIWCKQA